MITVQVGLYVTCCPSCGGTYAISQQFRDDKYERGGGWHCPYCRESLSYRDTEADRLRKQLADKDAAIARERQRLSQESAAHDQTRAELRDTEARRRAEKGAKTRLKNRINAGTCPCCDQSFSDLAEHMQTAHPEFAGTAENDEETSQ